MKRHVWAIILAAITGNVVITLYLIVQRSIADHLSLATCLLQLSQWDASNGYGPAAFSGGWAMAGIGQLMDIVVSLCWATLFTFFWVRYPALRRNTWAWGLAYGVVVMIVMLYVLVPIGHATPMRSSISNVIRVLVAHTVFFGLPLALVVAWCERSGERLRAKALT